MSTEGAPRPRGRAEAVTGRPLRRRAGIDRSRVEAMEARLKADVLREAGQYGAAVMVAHENDDFQVVEQWEAVTEVDVQTPLEARAGPRRGSGGRGVGDWCKGSARALRHVGLQGA